MNDTSARVQERYERMLLNKSPEERVRMACGLFDFSKELVISSIKAENPAISRKELQSQIFLRFYGEDFDTEKKLKIASYFLKHD